MVCDIGIFFPKDVLRYPALLYYIIRGISLKVLSYSDYWATFKER